MKLYVPFSILCGLSSTTGATEVLNGALRSCGLQMRALLHALQADLGLPAPSCLLGGGALGSRDLLQAQADCTGIPIGMQHSLLCEFSPIQCECITLASRTPVNSYSIRIANWATPDCRLGREQCLVTLLKFFYEIVFLYIDKLIN